MNAIEATWEQRAQNAQFRPALLARQCGISLRTLQRHFNRSYGLTVREWLRQVRMCEAYSRLKAGQRVKEVAIDLGYKQVSHFSRDFKLAYGVPPRAVSPPAKWNDGFPNLSLPKDRVEPGNLNYA